MNFRKSPLLALLFIFAFDLTSTATNIKGFVFDQNKTPLEFINVIVYNATDSSLVKAGVTESNGSFVFENLKIESIYIRTNFIGFEDFTSEIIDASAKETIDLGTIELVPASQQTATVNVVYKKPLVEVQADKTVFNVEGTINSAGLDALELLRKAPGVMLDNDNNISIKGRSGIMVYIDGKRSPLDADGLKAMLKNMQSSNIESIEIITNPSSKYDAAGTAGIINIKLKKNKNFGTNGSVQAGYAVQVYSKYNTSLNINHRNAKWNLFGLYGANKSESWGWMDLKRTQLNPLDSLKYIYDQRTSDHGDDLGHQFKAGADYFLNDNNTIGVTVNGNVSENESRSFSYTDISSYGESVSSALLAENEANFKRTNLNGNINYHFTKENGRDLMVDADYGDYSIRSNTFQPNTYSYPGQDIGSNSINYRFILPVDITIASLKADYEQNLWNGKFGAGVKWSEVKTENTLNRFNVFESGEVLDSLLSNSFAYDESISAAYVNYKRQWKKFGFQAGVRAEQTTSEGHLESFTSLSEEQNRDVNRSYLNFFPSGGITYSPNDTNQFALTFSRRIDRPSYQDLNPFESKLDELSYQRGNPFLQPQYGHVAELSYTYMYSMTAAFTYSYTTDFIANITDTANGNANYIMNKNLGFEEWAGFSLSTPIPINEKFNLYFNINAGRKHIKADFNNIDLVVWSYGLFGQASYSFPRDFSMELSGWFGGPNVWGATFVTDPMGSIDIGAKKTFFDGRAALRVALGDVLYSNVWNSRSSIPQVQIDGRGGYESRQFRVSFTYNFGNQSMRNNQRKSGADDLKNRVK
jgi:iron complex outermembrane receptor protein